MSLYFIKRLLFVFSPFTKEATYKIAILKLKVDILNKYSGAIASCISHAVWLSNCFCFSVFMKSFSLLKKEKNREC